MLARGLGNWWSAIALLAVALVGWWVFADGQWDLTLARAWLAAGAADQWPHDQEQPWKALYHVGPWPGILAAVGCAGVLVASWWWPPLRSWRRHALAGVLAVALGPGLVVNAVLKDHWGRPRPRDTSELGGLHPYQAPWVKGEAGKGKAFPCGHAAMGYVLCLAALPLWARRRRRWAVAVFAGACVWGTAIGVARMAAGGHFASDVFWSWWIPVAVGWILWHLVLRVPAYEADLAAGRIRPGPPSWPLVIVGAGLGVALLAGALVATPVYRAVRHAAAVAEGQPFTVDITVVAGDVVIVPWDRPTVAVEGAIQGFGFPGGRIASELAQDGTGFRLGISARGWYSELGGALTLHLPQHGLSALRVRTPGTVVVEGSASRPAVVEVQAQGGARLPVGW